MEWIPATLEEVAQIVEADLEACDDEQAALFEAFAVQPYFAPIHRFGKIENVVVVAKKGDEVMYWEDVEEGFNVSAVDAKGVILNHLCDQDELASALNRWIEA